jgi:hypothetical protein
MDGGTHEASGVCPTVVKKGNRGSTAKPPESTWFRGLERRLAVADE